MIKEYETNFIKKYEEISYENNILYSLKSELTNDIVSKVLEQLLNQYETNNEIDNCIIKSTSFLDIIKELNYDISNNSLLIEALEKAINILDGYNIKGYYTIYYKNDEKEHAIEINMGEYYITDAFNEKRRISFDLYGLSRANFKTTKTNIINVYYYMKNKQRKIYKPKIRKINNQLI